MREEDASLPASGGGAAFGSSFLSQDPGRTVMGPRDGACGCVYATGVQALSAACGPELFAEMALGRQTLSPGLVSVPAACRLP